MKNVLRKFSEYYERERQALLKPYYTLSKRIQILNSTLPKGYSVNERTLLVNSKGIVISDVNTNIRNKKEIKREHDRLMNNINNKLRI